MWALAVSFLSLVLSTGLGDATLFHIIHSRVELSGSSSFPARICRRSVNTCGEIRRHVVAFSEHVTPFDYEVKPDLIAVYEHMLLPFSFLRVSLVGKVLIPKECELFRNNPVCDNRLTWRSGLLGVGPSENTWHFSETTNHVHRGGTRDLHGAGRRLAGIRDLDDGGDTFLVPLISSRLAVEIRPNLRFSNAAGFLDTGPGCLCRAFGIERSGESGGKRQYAYECTKYAKISAPIGKFLRGVRSLPLSAKIGMTIVAALLTWLRQLIGSCFRAAQTVVAYVICSLSALSFS